MKIFLAIFLMIAVSNASKSIYIYDFLSDKSVECVLSDVAPFYSPTSLPHTQTYTAHISGFQAIFIILPLSESKELFAERLTKKSDFLRRCLSEYADIMRIHHKTDVYLVPIDNELSMNQYAMIPELIYHHSLDQRPLNRYASFITKAKIDYPLMFRGFILQICEEKFLHELFKGMDNIKFRTTLPKVPKGHTIDIFYTEKKELVLYYHKSPNQAVTIPLVDENDQYLPHNGYDFTLGKFGKKVNLLIVPSKEFLRIMRDPQLRTVYDRVAWRCELFTGQIYHLVGAFNFNAEDIHHISRFIAETSSDPFNVKIMGDRIFDTIYQYNYITFENIKLWGTGSTKNLDVKLNYEAANGLRKFRSYYLASDLDVEQTVFIYDGKSEYLSDCTRLDVHTLNGKYVTNEPNYHFPQTLGLEHLLIIVMDTEYTEEIVGDEGEAYDFQKLAHSMYEMEGVDVILMGVQSLRKRLDIIADVMKYHANPGQQIGTAGFGIYDTEYIPFKRISHPTIDEYLGRYPDARIHNNHVSPPPLNLYGRKVLQCFQIYDSQGHVDQVLPINTKNGEYVPHPDSENYVFKSGFDEGLRLVILNWDTFQKIVHECSEQSLANVHAHMTNIETKIRLFYIVCNHNFDYTDSQIISGMIDRHRGKIARHRIDVCTEKAIGTILQHKNFWPFRLWSQSEKETILGDIYSKL